MGGTTSPLTGLKTGSVESGQEISLFFDMLLSSLVDFWMELWWTSWMLEEGRSSEFVLQHGSVSWVGGLSHQSLSDVHSSLCMHKQNYNIQPHLLLFFFLVCFPFVWIKFRCNAEYIVLIILQLVITFFSAAHWMNGCQCQRTYERMNGHETAMNDNINDQNCKPKTEGEGTEIKFKRRTQER